MGRVGSPYEVRCLRCDVSFPPEARRCLHCGGPTSPSDAVANTGLVSAPSPPFGGPDPTPIGIGSSGPFPWSRDSGSADPGALASHLPDAAAPSPDEGKPAVGATLLRSLGSVLWLVALVAFSIVRSCSEG